MLLSHSVMSCVRKELIVPDISVRKTYPHGAVVGVAHDDGVHRAPLLIGELPRVDEIDVRFERTLEAVLPAH